MFPKKEEVQCVDKLSLVGNSPTRCTTVADPGGSQGAMDPPFLPSSLVDLYVL